MGVQVTFISAQFRIDFPTFAGLTDAQLNGIILPIAQIYCRNDGGGPVTLASTQTALLNLMVAHVATLLFGPDGATPTTLVGRIASAGQGSVNVSTEFPVTQSEKWFTQTQWGAAYLQAVAAYRSMTYIPKTRPLSRRPVW